MRANNVLATIGNTPHIRINRLFGSTQEQDRRAVFRACHTDGDRITINGHHRRDHRVTLPPGTAIRSRFKPHASGPPAGRRCR